MLYTADKLSRAPLKVQVPEDSFQNEVETYINKVVANLPTTPDRLQRYREAEASDTTCVKVIEYYQCSGPTNAPRKRL
jgi:hypothetical protein